MEGLIEPHNLLFLGEGQNGIVLLVNGDIAGRMVVKITFSDPFIKEARIAKKLAVLKPYTQAFIATFDSFEHQGLLESWKPMLPPRDQDGRLIDWEKYEGRKLTYIVMEHSNFRIQYPDKAAPGGVVFWHNVTSENAKKLLFILLHGLYIARRELAFSHNDIHDGQIVLFMRNAKKPVTLGEGYEIRDCPIIPKFIDFGASVMEQEGDLFSDDVAQLVITFDRLYSQTELMETEEFENASGSLRTNWKVIKALLDCSYFAEFHGGPDEVNAICMSCMSRALFTVEATGFHVCSKTCANKIY